MGRKEEIECKKALYCNNINGLNECIKNVFGVSFSFDNYQS